ncbi:MAG: hypothetical protein HY296_01235 [Thaumarchaeota archaeon]|nr:hypothetical protein [Nitrososphaerota archaeon]
MRALTNEFRFALAAVGVIALVSIASLALLTHPGNPGSGVTLRGPDIAWGRQCTQTNGTVAFSVQGVLGGRSAPEGCAERWAIMIPPTEGGNLSAQASWILSAQGVTGVFLDDYGLNNASVQALMAESISRFDGPVCPVLYAYQDQPPLSKGAPCVLLVIQPLAGATYFALTYAGGCDTDACFPNPRRTAYTLTEAQWYATAANATAYIDAKAVMLLYYAKTYSEWQTPLPPHYGPGVRNYSAAEHHRLVVFG